MIFARVLSVIIGYICGNLILGFLLGEAKGVDLRKEGSGNVGATNTLRTLGKGMGVVALLCDVLKVVAACFISWFIFRDQFGDNANIIFFYAGLGAVLGHCFPIYMLKNGGKGVASTCGMAFMTSLPATGIGLSVFILTVIISKFVSLGSIFGVTTYYACVIIFGQLGMLGLSGTFLIEAYIITGFMTALCIFKHKENIKRLLSGTERKFSLKKKEEKKEENNEN